MWLESADPRDSDELREKIESWEKFVKNALFVLCDVTLFHMLNR